MTVQRFVAGFVRGALSGILFAICADVILISLRGALRDRDEVVRAFADGTAIVVNDYSKSLCIIAKCF